MSNREKYDWLIAIIDELDEHYKSLWPDEASISYECFKKQAKDIFLYGSTYAEESAESETV